MPRPTPSITVYDRASSTLECRPMVLIVHADDDNREMYAESLRHHGCFVVPVNDVPRALRLARWADVIITDVALRTRNDGVWLIARLRRHGRTTHTPIIVLTAHVFPEDRLRAEAAGCDLFLPMPCLPQSLTAAVQRLAARAPN